MLASHLNTSVHYGLTPATHAAVAAVVACRVRRLPVALAAAFGLHFVCDFFYHFEAFYPLSVLGRWGLERTMFGLFVMLAVLGAPIVLWTARRDRQTGLFALYSFLLSLIPFDPNLDRRVVWAVALSVLWLTLTRHAEMRRWIPCAVAAYLPDLIRHWIPALRWFHEWVHYDSQLDAGDWVSLLGSGRWRIGVNDRIFDPFYQAGYALEILFEAAVLFGCLYWLTRRPSVTDLSPVHDQANPVHEGSLVGE